MTNSISEWWFGEETPQSWIIVVHIELPHLMHEIHFPSHSMSGMLLATGCTGTQHVMHPVEVVQGQEERTHGQEPDSRSE